MAIPAALAGAGISAGTNLISGIYNAQQQARAKRKLARELKKERQQRNLMRNYVRGQAKRDTARYRNLQEAPYDTPTYQSYLSRIAPQDATREQAANLEKMGISPGSNAYAGMYNRMLTQNNQQDLNNVINAMYETQQQAQNPYSRFMRSSESQQPERNYRNLYSSLYTANQPNLQGVGRGLGSAVSAYGIRKEKLDAIKDLYNTGNSNMNIPTTGAMPNTNLDDLNVNEMFSTSYKKPYTESNDLNISSSKRNITSGNTGLYSEIFNGPGKTGAGLANDSLFNYDLGNESSNFGFDYEDMNNYGGYYGY